MQIDKVNEVGNALVEATIKIFNENGFVKPAGMLIKSSGIEYIDIPKDMGPGEFQAVLKMMARDRNADGVFFVAEGFFLPWKQGDEEFRERYDPSLRVRDQDGAIEAICIYLENGREMKAMKIPIPEDRKITEMPEWMHPQQIVCGMAGSVEKDDPMVG